MKNARLCFRGTFSFPTLLILLLLIPGCGDGDWVSTSQIGGGTGSADNHAATNDTEAEYIASAKSDLTLDISSDEELANTSLLVPAGSLEFDTTIAIEQGQTIANAETAAELALEDNASISAAGPAVAITSTTEMDASSPLSLSIPYESLSLNLTECNLVVIYKVLKVKEEFEVVTGMLTSDDAEVENSVISFEIMHFGVYQAACLATNQPLKPELKEPPLVTEKPTPEPITGTWSLKTCEFDYDKYISETLTIADDQTFEFRREEFADSSCYTPEAAFIVKGTSQLVEESIEAEELNQVSFTVSEVSIILLSEDRATLYNRTATCGFSDWSIDEPKDLQDVSCLDEDGTLQVGETWQTEYKVDDQYLSMDDGTEAVLSTP